MSGRKKVKGILKWLIYLFTKSTIIKEIEKDGAVYKATTYDGKQWFIPINSESFAHWALTAMEVTERYLDVIKKGDIIVEVGACTGEYTIEAAKRVGERGRVYSFEADPLGCECVKKNAKLNNLNNIEVINKPVSDIIGRKVSFKMNKNLSGGYIEKDNKGSILTTTLDEYLNGRKVNILKMTVNGHEPEVLTGAHKLLKNIRYIIFQSIHHQKLIRTLKEYDFKVKKLDDSTFDPKNVKTALLEHI
ncbi:MAG: FkbM family methyltransferase [Thermoplasmata archaeon]|nr:FkbM family methyltransferase [Thermoplasmata archaeon]